MTAEVEKETKGAWIIHHDRKLALDANGASEFSAIDEAAKAASLISRLGGHDKVTLMRRITRNRLEGYQLSQMQDGSLWKTRPRGLE